ncbi:hypothetical protein N7532_003278 [Penicillium argentinense]|uniref:Uncharacterized protein n=1 Tax=Penicillium argentinense TaxID=1131581 RepID=A0A9W9KDU8_9EURO|nr:uncharacterized protein N7532_003278 [Penicillium argentinense]KAJ5102749.1 hypothetical protein N7532_003278 [Penicillium argentinense]
MDLRPWMQYDVGLSRYLGYEEGMTEPNHWLLEPLAVGTTGCGNHWLWEPLAVGTTGCERGRDVIKMTVSMIQQCAEALQYEQAILITSAVVQSKVIGGMGTKRPDFVKAGSDKAGCLRQNLRISDEISDDDEDRLSQQGKFVRARTQTAEWVRLVGFSDSISGPSGAIISPQWSLHQACPIGPLRTDGLALCVLLPGDGIKHCRWDAILHRMGRARDCETICFDARYPTTTPVSADAAESGQAAESHPNGTLIKTGLTHQLLYSGSLLSFSAQLR